MTSFPRACKHISIKGLVEPYMDEFRKFNSNTGWFYESAKLMSALSHFLYDFTDGAYLLCDPNKAGGGEL